MRRNLDKKIEKMCLDLLFNSDVVSPVSNALVDTSAFKTFPEKEYTKLVELVAKSAKPIQQQLVAVLFPFFVYLYVVLLDIDLGSAKGFVGKFSNLFRDSDEYGLRFRHLSELNTKPEVMSQAYFRKFFEEGCEVQMSDANHKLLLKFFKAEKCVGLSHFLRGFFIVKH